MIIVKLIGGLGNQMFQYAMARRIAYVHNVPLKLDITGFNDYKCDTPRTYELKHLNIIEDFASKTEIDKFKTKKGFAGLILRCKEKLSPYYKRAYIREKSLRFDPNMLQISKNAYLEGYWTTEKYFDDICDLIRREFTVKHKADSINEQLAQTIRGCEAVSLHIRRGDYVSNPQANQFHGLCPLEYYYKGIEILGTKIENPHFFVFSDDPKWAKENLNIEFPVNFVTHNGAEKNYEDLRLMCFCKHNIIANSTFSWWGAWLNKNPGKIVIAPKKWFNNEDIDTRDVIPESWERL